MRGWLVATSRAATSWACACVRDCRSLTHSHNGALTGPTYAVRAVQGGPLLVPGCQLVLNETGSPVLTAMAAAVVRRHVWEFGSKTPGQQLTSHRSTAEQAVADSTDCSRDRCLQQTSTHTMCIVQPLVVLACAPAPLISCLSCIRGGGRGGQHCRTSALPVCLVSKWCSAAYLLMLLLQV